MQNISKGLKAYGERKKTIFGRIQLWWWDVTRHSWYEKRIVFPFKDFKSGIKNLIKWFPIVWKDRDWDDAYILYVLKFKLANTRDRILKNDIIIDEDQNEIKRDITICVNLIDSFVDEKYSMEYMDYLKREMFFVDYVSDDPDFPLDEDEKKDGGYKELKFKVLEDNLDAYFAKYPLDYTKTKKLIAARNPDRVNDREYEALVMSDLRQKKANSLLWKIINDRIQRWWD